MYARALFTTSVDIAEPAAHWHGGIRYPEPNHPDDEGHKAIADSVLAVVA